MQHTPVAARAVDPAAARPGRVPALKGCPPYSDAPRAAGTRPCPAGVEMPTGYGALWREAQCGPVVAVRRAGDDGAAPDPAGRSEPVLGAALPADGLRAVGAALRRLDVCLPHLNSGTGTAGPQGPFGGGRRCGGFGPCERGRAARDLPSATATVCARRSRAESR